MSQQYVLNKQPAVNAGRGLHNLLLYLRRKAVVLVGGDRHARGLVSAVVQDPQLAAALHELVAVVVCEEALPVTRRPHQRLYHTRYTRIRQRISLFFSTWENKTNEEAKERKNKTKKNKHNTRKYQRKNRRKMKRKDSEQQVLATSTAVNPRSTN